MDRILKLPCSILPPSKPYISLQDPSGVDGLVAIETNERMIILMILINQIMYYDKTRDIRLNIALRLKKLLRAKCLIPDLKNIYIFKKNYSFDITFSLGVYFAV